MKSVLLTKSNILIWTQLLLASITVREITCSCYHASFQNDDGFCLCASCCFQKLLHLFICWILSSFNDWIRHQFLNSFCSYLQSQLFEGLEDDDFSFGSDTFQSRKSVKKLTIKKVGQNSNTPSRASSVSGEPPNVTSLREDDGR